MIVTCKVISLKDWIKENATNSKESKRKDIKWAN